MTNYQQAKRALKTTADMAKSQFKSDKPMIRQIINDSCDDLKRNHYNLTEHKQSLLDDYACTLHP